MPRKKKKSDPTRWKREILGVLMAATGGFTLVALWPWDPGWNRTPETLNRVGILGSISAFYLYRGLGFGALAVAGAVVVFGLLLLFDRWSRKASVLGLSGLAAVWLLLALFGVADSWIAGPSPWADRAGALGSATAAGLVEVVGLAGALMFCVVAVLVLAVATFQVSLADTMEAGFEAGRAGGRRARAGFGRVGDRVARWSEEHGSAEPEVELEPDFGSAPAAPAPTLPPRTPAADPAGVAPAGTGPTSRGRRRSAGPADSWLPPLSLLEHASAADSGQSADDLDRLGGVLIDKLRSFNVEGEIVAIHSGPVLTQFEVKPAPGVKVNQIANLADDLALAMRAQRIRIVAPIPGKGAVGIEIPNPRPRVVTMREVLESPAWSGFGGKLPLALGHEIAGSPIVTDLSRMPHLLIAGATGSGKSVCINAIVTSLLYRYGPDAVRFIMIDPKMLELVVYNGIPHLLHPVVVEHKESAKALKWTVSEMERRYRLLAANGIRSLADFNARVKDRQDIVQPGVPDSEPRPLPYIVVLIDELADLMLTVQQEIEEPLARLAQMARAVGIHLVLATQRPSVNVITGVIKANFPSRISFQVSSKIDSRTVLDMNGAEQLLGNGDMLFLPADRAEPIRIQGAYLSGEETAKVVEYLREAGRRLNAEDVAPPVDIIAEASELEIAALDERDELFFAAAKVVVDHDQGSTSLIQRRLRVGYSRAARILDQLERANIVGPPDGTKPRQVLINSDDLESLETRSL